MYCMKSKKTIKHLNELHVNDSNVFKSFFKGSNAYTMSELRDMESGSNQKCPSDKSTAGLIKARMCLRCYFQ